jgi:hypothetical protein
MKLHQNRLRTHLTLEKLDKLCFIHMNRRTLRRTPSDLKRTLHSLTEEEKMAAEIIMATVDAEEAHKGILQNVKITEEAGEDLLQLSQARKRHRRDTIPAVASGVGIGTAGTVKRSRR